MKTRLPLIFLLNVAGFALFLSWYLPVNHGFWFPLDAAIFHFFNNGLVENHAFLWLVALRREGEHVGALRFLRLGILVMPPTLILSLLALSMVEP